MSTRYFGMPGHCHDIDGDLWHEPGACPGASVNCTGRCCGYEGIDDDRARAAQGGRDRGDD